MELTDKQKKTLEIFSKYARSYGKKIVSMTFYFDTDGSVSDNNHSFYDETGGSSLDSYETINNLLNDILDVLEIPNMNDNTFQIKFTISCIEKELTIELFEDVMSGEFAGDFEEFPETEGFNSLAEYMKQKGYSEGIVEFNGSDDSGYIEERIIFDELKTEKGINDFVGVEDFLYEMLNNTMGGWEINEGSYGTIHFNLDERTVTVEMTVNQMTTEDRGILFRSEF